MNRRSKIGLILLSVFLVIGTAAFFVYLNFNKLISTALKNVFESSQVADVYELTFENLRVNPLVGNISVLDVTFRRKETPRKSYPYINSYIQLKTNKLILENVNIWLLLKSNQLQLEKIAVIRPDIELDINGFNPILFPFKNATLGDPSGEKTQIDSYFLGEFQLTDASFRLINSAQKREFTVENFNMSFQDLSLEKNSREDLFYLKELEFSVDKFSGSTQESLLKQLSFSDFKLKFDSVDVQTNLDTLIFNFQDFASEINDLNIQTRDSLFHIMMSSFDLSYRDQTIALEKLSFKPNVSNAVIQKNYKFQHTQFSGTVGKINFDGVNFDSLLYANKFFIETISLDSISALVYKDNTKAKDLKHFPEYLAQVIMGIPNPVQLKTVKATNVNLINEERKPDGSIARVHINRGTAEVKNITNLAPEETLTINAVAYLANQVQFKLDLGFSYSKPQFTFSGVMQKFELADLNPIIAAYTPAKFTAGVADEIKFSGLARNSSSTGNLTFLYHDLKVNLELEDKAKWVNDLITFGANTALHSNNPVSPNFPARSVKFQADRDMNKGFVNLIIKSLLDGMKETMLLSKENRKEFNQTKREARKEAKKGN
jgi:uncharacterized membrane protein